MTCRARVFTRVTIRRTVAAQRCAAFLTRSQMNPGGTDFHTFGAFADCRLLDRSNCVEMRTAAVSHDSLTVVMFCLLTRFVVTQG